ncbi:MAG: M42 family metallopeptidase [Lawsonibacter sp.]|nr:M42 family metallopeptidase [Lawsonibacter sp.]
MPVRAPAVFERNAHYISLRKKCQGVFLKNLQLLPFRIRIGTAWNPIIKWRSSDLNYEQILGRLCALSGPSGFEESVTQAAAELLRPLTDKVYITRLGSVAGVRRCGRENAPKLLLDAHLDEIGFIVTGHDEGFLRFAPLGGVDPRMLPDREVVILTAPPVFGTVACLPPHVQSGEDMDKSQPIKDLVIDVGLSQETAERRIPAGTPAAYRGGCTPLGEDLLCGKALDDRCGFAVLLDVLERLKDKPLDVDLYVLGSTQEETHSTGAVTAAYEIEPNLCVAVDVTHGDSPDASKHETFKLGGGPVIGVGPNCARSLSGRLKELAKELDMPVQIEVMSGSSGTNAWPIQVSREGVATAVLSIPERYMHTPVEVVHKQDLEDTAALLAAFVESLGEEGVSC